MRQSTATRQIFWAVVIAYTLCDSSEFSVFNGFVPADFDPQFVEAVDLQDAIALCQGNCRTFSRLDNERDDAVVDTFFFGFSVSSDFLGDDSEEGELWRTFVKQSEPVWPRLCCTEHISNATQPAANVLQWARRRDRLPRVDCNVSRQRFVDEFVLPREPVMLSQCMKSWRAPREWTLRQLRRRYSNETTFRAEHVGQHYHQDVPFGEIYDALLERPHRKKIYVFDTLEKKPELVAHYRVPPVFRPPHDLYKSAEQEWLLPRDYGPIRWLVLGERGTGSTWHSDPIGIDAWNALVAGHKLWLLLPPNLADGDGYAPDADVPQCDPTCSDIAPHNRHWMTAGGDAFFLGGGLRQLLARHHALADAQGLRVVLQEPGETIYVPAGWQHAVYNLDLCVAVTEGVGERTSLFRFPHIFERYIWPDFAREPLPTLRRHIQKLYYTVMNRGERAAAREFAQFAELVLENEKPR